MTDIELFKWNDLWWKDRVTPVERDMYQPLKFIRNEAGDEIANQVETVYLFLRNQIVQHILVRVKHRRKYGWGGTHQLTVGQLIFTMKRFTLGCRHNLISRKELDSAYRSIVDGDVATATITVISIIPSIQPPSYLHPVSLVDWEIDKWYRYVSKAMGVYNVPRPDLAERQAKRKAERDNHKACVDRALEIAKNK